MRASRCIGAVTIVALAGACGTGAYAQVSGLKWDELTRAIRDVESAVTLDDASAAYARGCAQNRQSVKLQDAYLRRMLKFGRPDLGLAAANILAKADKRNPLAWGLIAYRHAKAKRYLTALPLALRAAELDPNNPGNCHNAAQLLIWYSSGNRKAVDADTSDLMKRFKAAATSNTVFGKAYKAASVGWGKLEREKDAKKKEADEAAAEAKKLDQELEQLRRTLHSRGQRYEAEARRALNAKRSIQRAEDSMRVSADERNRISQERRRNDAIRDYREAQRAAAKLLNEGKKIKKDLLDTKKKVDSKQAHAARLLREYNEIADGVPSNFGWLPPAVDGVVTPDAAVTAAKPTPSGRTGKTRIKNSYLVPTKSTPGGTPSDPSLSEKLAEAEAADKLSLAKICMDSKDANMKASAKRLLGEILSKYPTTKAAAEAKQLLEKLP